MPLARAIQPGGCETENGWPKLAPLGGTINTLLIINHSLTESALARSVVTMTEAKSDPCNDWRFAAFTRKTSRRELAPISIASLPRPRKASRSPAPSLMPNSANSSEPRCAMPRPKLWAGKNGLETSSTRLLFPALKCFGNVEASFLSDIAPMLTEHELELLKRTSIPSFMSRGWRLPFLPWPRYLIGFAVEPLLRARRPAENGVRLACGEQGEGESSTRFPRPSST